MMTGPAVHVVPIGDFRDHDTTPECWCHPAQNYDGVWVHNSMDRREHTIEKGVTQ